MFRVVVFLLIVVMSNCASPQATSKRATAIDTLRQAMQHGSSFFVKVHAGEALALNNEPEGVEAVFTKLRTEDKSYVIGSTRVLARVYSHEKKNQCIDLIIDRYLHDDSTHPRLVAVESLGKLGYSNPLPQITQDAQTGTGGFKAMARWVLSNDGTPQTEDSLAELLALPDITDWRGAAYAFRFKKEVKPSTVEKLSDCVKRLSPGTEGRVYAVSSLFVHAPTDANKQALLTYLKGAPNERYETAEGLSLKGTAADYPVLDTLLHDADNDVRVAAANAIIKIEARAAQPN